MQSIKLDHFNTFMITMIILIFIIYYVMKYNEITENFNTYGYVACPPQFTKVGTTQNMYYNDGYIGIGTNSPAHKLDVNGDINISTGSSFKINGSAIPTTDTTYSGGTGITINGTTINSDITQYTNSDVKTLLNSGITGGIKTVDDWVRVKGSYGIYWEDWGGGWCMSDDNWIQEYGNKNVWMGGTVAVGSRLGIGTSIPSYKLDVYGGRDSGARRMRFFKESKNVNASYVRFTDTVAKFNGSIWSTSSIGASSDERIKKDIRDLDDNEMLNKLMLIKPKKYKYKDKLKSDKEVYGFIAQQVKEVMGDAGVDLKPEYIYDINDIGTINNNIITCKYNLEVSSNYRINTLDEGEKDIVIEKKLGYNQYKISGYTSNKSQEIHIQGKKVDDFHVLNKSAIFTMNVGATQELYKIIMNQQKQIQILLNKV